MSTATNTVMYRMVSGIQLAGTNIIADTNYVKVILTKSRGGTVSFTPTSISKTAIYFTVFDNNKVDTGIYYVTVKNLAETVELTFTDTANGKTGAAYINSDSSTIEVNWLYEWKSIDSIEPVITLPPGATIEPASGRRVAFKDGISYTVTAQNGTSKMYSLRKI